MARRTINLPQSSEDLARESAREGESFSATIARLIEQGARAERGAPRPRYVASGEGPEDLGNDAERYLRELAEAGLTDTGPLVAAANRRDRAHALATSLVTELG